MLQQQDRIAAGIEEDPLAAEIDQRGEPPGAQVVLVGGRVVEEDADFQLRLGLPRLALRASLPRDPEQRSEGDPKIENKRA